MKVGLQYLFLSLCEDNNINKIFHHGFTRIERPLEEILQTLLYNYLANIWLSL